MRTGDVILAIASPPGHSPRGIIRISGERALDLIEPHLETAAGEGIAEPARRRGVFRARLSLDDRNIPAIALIFPAPNSYTGEDALELQLPGNPLLLDSVIEAVRRWPDYAGKAEVPDRRANEIQRNQRTEL